MKAEDVVAALDNHYREQNGSWHSQKWIWFSELRVATGYGRDSGQRFDLWGVPTNVGIRRSYRTAHSSFGGSQ